MHDFFRALFALLILGGPAWADTIETSAGPMRAEVMVSGLDTPWAFGFLPDGTLLVTEREGKLLLIRDGAARELRGLPEDLVAEGQGGLLDVLVPRDFAERREIFLSYAKKQRRNEGTAVYRARLSDDGTRLEDGQTIFEIARGSGGGFHFGSRLVEARDGTLFVTVGDRGNQLSAQDLRMHNGSVLRITRDGAAPDDNPFVAKRRAQPEIWSFGHRNPQGAALDANGQLWVNEHGARGGDEVNRITEGRQLWLAGDLLWHPLQRPKDRRGHGQGRHGTARNLLGPVHRAFGHDLL